ncbi:MAG: Hsp20/alpha crystallin family protein [Thermomicrobiales bacterium]
MSGIPAPRERPGRDLSPRVVQELSPDDLAMLLGRGVPAETPPQPQRAAPTTAPTEDGWSPRLDIFVEGEELVLVVELPGVRKRDLHVALDRGVLVVEGEVHPGGGDGARQYFRAERPRGRFRRLLQLPFEVRAEEISAHLEHGVLEVRLPQAAHTEPRRIPVH